VRFACLCCGYRTLAEEPPGTYAICPVCFWEDDYAQGADEYLEGGANRVALSDARESFAAVGASDIRLLALVRGPLPEERSDFEPPENYDEDECD
jgi:Cysteine-rich CPCC